MTRFGFYYGWVIVALSFVTLTSAYGLLYSYSVFAPEMAAALALDRATVAAPFSLCVATYAILSLVSGRLTDSLGPRRLIFGGGILLAAGFLVLSQATAAFELFLGMSVLCGIGLSVAYIPTSAAIVRWFVADRGLALALGSMGIGASMVVGPMAAAALTAWLGWRDAAVVLGLAGGALVALAALGFKRDPGDPALRRRGGEALAVEPSWTLAEARRTLAFWLICALYALTWGVMFFPYAHMVGIAGDSGFGAGTGVRLLAVAGVAGCAGRPLIGWLSDRTSRTTGLVTMLLAQIVACAIFASSPTLMALYLAAGLFGMGASAGVTLYAAVVGDVFGRASIGAIAGFAFAFTCTAGGLGPLVGGHIRDRTGAYDAAFWLGAALNGVALVIAILLRRAAARLPRPGG